MNKITWIVFFLLFGCLWGVGQEKKEGYKFTDLKRLPATSVKSQDRVGTCWVWSTVSFFESEMMRLGKDSVSLSPMYVVWNTYRKKADRYLRVRGHMNFGEGGSAIDVPWAIKNDGIVPLEVYLGLNYGEQTHVHGELDGLLKGYMDLMIRNPNRKISTAWEKGYEGILNAYLGEKPETFEFRGKTYTPRSFAESTGLNMDDYIWLTSFMYQPYYQSYIFESPDNWLWGSVYNLPLNEFMDVLDGAIDKGFTFAWSSDISEKGFSRKGIAVVPTADIQEMSGSEMAKWVALTKSEQEKQLYKLDKPGKEKTITPELRQEAFDNFQTTDDHAMHIIGKAVDQAGNKYFIVKNSWGNYNEYGGYFYASYPFVAYKTTTVLIHKDALPNALKKKMGIR